MYKLEFTLKQHTPIIHFQHDQEGATFRASEAKPKLDRFLIKKLQLTELVIRHHEHVETPKYLYENYFINQGKQHLALNYKIFIEIITGISNQNKESLTKFEKIKLDDQGGERFKFDPKARDKIKRNDLGEPVHERGPGLKGFFGNLDKESERKELIIAKEIRIRFSSINKDLLDSIEKNFEEFLFLNNFGSRPTKGFGSLFLKNNNYNGNAYYSYFDIEIHGANNALFDQMSQLFERINLFYSALRSGINLKSPVYDYASGGKKQKKDANGISIFKDVYYFKSLLFQYALKKLDAQWEKKSIKEKFFNNDLSFIDKNTGNTITKYYGQLSQVTKRDTHLNDSPLSTSKELKILIKDLFGLSSQEAWLSYGNATISKTQALGPGNKSNENNQSIFRYKSPIQFKPIQISEKIYRVYIQIIENEPVILNKWFCIESSSEKTSSIFLKTPNRSEFSIRKFFEYVFEEKDHNGRRIFDIDNHVEKANGFHSRDEHLTLRKIFKDISDNKK